jgi:L-fuconolactonase
VLVDTHVHVISPDLARFPLKPPGVNTGPWWETHPCSADLLRLLMDDAGVDRAVLVQPMGAYSYDNSYAADAAASHPDRLTSACIVDMEGDDPVGALTYWVTERGMAGIRLFTLTDPSATGSTSPARSRCGSGPQSWASV